jgi:hypothetical protein
MLRQKRTRRLARNQAWADRPAGAGRGAAGAAPAARAAVLSSSNSDHDREQSTPLVPVVVLFFVMGCNSSVNEGSSPCSAIFLEVCLPFLSGTCITMLFVRLASCCADIQKDRKRLSTAVPASASPAPNRAATAAAVAPGTKPVGIVAGSMCDLNRIALRSLCRRRLLSLQVSTTFLLSFSPAHVHCVAS